MLKAPTGGIRWGRRAISKERENIPSSKSLIRTRRHTQNGQANVCRPKPSLNLRPAVVCREKSMYGAMSFALAENGWRIHGRGNFRSTKRAKMAMLESHQ